MASGPGEGLRAVVILLTVALPTMILLTMGGACAQSSRARDRLSALSRSSCVTRSSVLVSSSSLRMTTVATSVSTPPSVALSNLAPPVGSESTTVKVSSFSYVQSSMISIVIDCETWL